MTKKKTRRQTRRQREAIKKRQQAQQNQYIAIGAGIILVIVVVMVSLQVIGENEQTASSGECLTAAEIAARPLANVAPLARDGYFSAAPPFCLDENVDYGAVIQTEKGNIGLDLFEDDAPLTVNSFVYLAQQGYFDGVPFHRVIPGFMAQGGDPTGTGGGGPGYEFVNETQNGLIFDRPGLLAMANRGPNTNGSQFFITYDMDSAQADLLNGGYTIFGELVSGADVLGSLTPRDPDTVLPTAGPGDLIFRIDITSES